MFLRRKQGFAYRRHLGAAYLCVDKPTLRSVDFRVINRTQWTFDQSLCAHNKKETSVQDNYQGTLSITSKDRWVECEGLVMRQLGKFDDIDFTFLYTLQLGIGDQDHPSPCHLYIACQWRTSEEEADCTFGFCPDHTGKDLRKEIQVVDSDGESHLLFMKEPVVQDATIGNTWKIQLDIESRRISPTQGVSVPKSHGQTSGCCNIV